MPIIVLLLIVLCGGCQAVPKQATPKESTQDVIKALGTVTSGLTNKDISEEDLKRVAKQAQHDPQVKSALEAMNTSFEVNDTGVVYCPIDGQRFNSRVKECPKHKVKLLPVE